MLRALSRQDKIGRLDWLGSFARRSLRPLCLAAITFVLMHCEPAGDCAPLAVAFFAAGLASGESAAALVIGCLAGMLRLPLREINMVSAIACAGVLAGEMVFSMVERLRACSGETRASLNAGLGVLLPALVWANGAALASVQGLGCAALAAAAAPFLRCALDVHPGRKRLMKTEKLGLALLAGGCLAGLHALNAHLAAGAAVLLILLLPHLGAAGGALWGLALLGGGMELLACLALCGLVSGLEIYTRRWQRALALAVLGAALMLWTEALGAMVPALTAGLYLLLPGTWIDRLEALSAPEKEKAWDPGRMAQTLGRESERRLRALGDAFGDMAESCGTAAETPDEQELICAMRDRLCADCPGYGECWTGGERGGARFLCRLIQEAMWRMDAPAGMRVLYADGEIPPDVLRSCRRGRMIPERLGLLLRDFAEKRRAEIKRCATDRLLSVQLTQAREILYDLAERQSKPLQGRRLEALDAALDAAGLGDCQATAFGSDSPELRLIRPGGWTREAAAQARRALRRAWGGDYVSELDGGGLRLRQRPRYGVECGTACQSGTAGEPCGDSHMLRRMEGGRMAAMISDGMGSGGAAAVESGETLRLLWRFLDAGIARPLALETVNQQMLMRSGEDMFATVDMCILDLSTGVAEFSKPAACRTLSLRDGGLHRLEGGRLPLGILEGVQPDVRRVKLRDGDVIVMGSDGVMELGDGMMIERIARLSAAMPAQQLAEKLVREAAIRRSRGRSDDMTCICLHISDLKQKKGAASAEASTKQFAERTR